MRVGAANTPATGYSTHNVLANRKRQKKAGMKRMDVALPDAQPRLNS